MSLFCYSTNISLTNTCVNIVKYCTSGVRTWTWFSKIMIISNKWTISSVFTIHFHTVNHIIWSETGISKAAHLTCFPYCFDYCDDTFVAGPVDSWSPTGSILTFKIVKSCIFSILIHMQKSKSYMMHFSGVVLTRFAHKMVLIYT